ncbi:hypothetical protein [Cohnella rhizosphaerae]|uniref:Uncharacterized protein n=1 Tax=Cohnella rhizosphaerae TaxID=1457232 RepID=A0A9X4KVR4_9BACL|nr:hypothetical protein [Cohnella rhizosphaerae]MDG0808972.1 hypothetical protein [Cohnella rhizosphaerae]
MNSPTPTVAASPSNIAGARPIKIARFSGLLGEQLPFKAEDIVGIRWLDRHLNRSVEVPKERYDVILQNLYQLNLAEAIVQGNDDTIATTASLMTFTTKDGGSYAIDYDPSNNVYGLPDTKRIFLASARVWLLKETLFNNSEWSAYGQLYEQARNEPLIDSTAQRSAQSYDRSRLAIGGLDYLGWEKKFLLKSSGIPSYDDLAGGRGLIQFAERPERNSLYPEVMKLPGTVVFSIGISDYATSDGVKVGLSQDEVVARLGSPDARTETKWSYRIGDSLSFHLLFKDGKVRFVSLTEPE